ncbi:hypothetical protein [Pseudomonas savastanoi]|uniref:hypothetical protein n=1 Tax=Pseudomonas savastanoi TaxID=29438 RepID=UPI001CE294C8|nr:hypothetical protein [Pseudomonas savastanoi]
MARPCPVLDVDEQFERQQMDDCVGNTHTASSTPRKLNTPEKNTADERHGFGVNDCRHRVGGVMKAVDELEGEDKSQGEQKAHKHPGIKAR